MENAQKKTGYPSIDKPLPEATLYEYIYQLNQDNLEKAALNYYGKTISYTYFLTM